MAQAERDFAGRILPVDENVSRVWGHLSADRTRPVVDRLVAATAIVHDLVLVTRNIRDIKGIDLLSLNPWKAIAIPRRR